VVEATARLRFGEKQGRAQRLAYPLKERWHAVGNGCWYRLLIGAEGGRRTRAWGWGSVLWVTGGGARQCGQR
jgi:hypothetical protein